MKLCVILTLVLSVASQPPTCPGRAVLGASLGQQATAQKEQKGDEISRLLDRIKSQSAAERREAIDQLGDAGDPRAVAPLIAALKDQDPDVRASTANALGQLGDKRAIDPLTSMLNDEVSFVRAASARVLGQLGDVRAVD